MWPRLSRLWVRGFSRGQAMVSVGVGRLTLTGFAPAVVATAIGSVTAQPDTGTLTVTAFAPTVVAGQSVNRTTATGTLTLAGQAPTVQTPRVARPGVGALTATGYAGTVQVPRNVQPNVGALTVTAYAPTVAAGGFAAVVPDLISGITSAQGEANGWNARVKAALTANPSSVVRTSNTVVTITLPAVASYDVTATETITVTVPATALTSGVARVASPTFTVASVAGAANVTPSVGALTVSGFAPSVSNGTSTVAGPGVNEPAGMTQAFDSAFDTAPPTSAGSSWYTEVGSSYVDVVADSGSPSGGNVLRLKFPSGYTGGTSPMVITWNESGKFPSNTGTLYLRLHFKTSSNWTNNGNNGTKFIWPRSGTDTNHYFPLNHYPPAGDPIKTGLSLQGAYLGGVDTDYIESTTHAHDTWHEMEAVLYQGTTASANNGTIKIWMNGTLVVDETGVKMKPDGASLTWSYMTIEPVYGYGSNTVPADQYIYIDHFYASVK